MAIKRIAVDSGKFATKFAFVNETLDKTQRGKFRTKLSHGVMGDDAVENGTWVCEMEGETYKIGNGALYNAALETSKKSDIHKRCVQLAMAFIASEVASEKEMDEFHVAVGIPVDDYGVVERRLAYKDFILPDGAITVTYRDQKSAPMTKKFTITNKYVYPESAGALYLDPEANSGISAVIDIGNLNVNATYYSAFEPDLAFSRTAELGGQKLISGLAAELAAKLGARCDERTVAGILSKPYEERYLVSQRPEKAEEIKQKSREIIDAYLLRHVTEIKNLCDAIGWSLEYMHLTFVGGTSKILSREIREIFGDSVTIVEDPEYANAVGFLRRMVAYEDDVLIPVTIEK